MPTVKQADLEEAFLFVSMSPDYEASAYRARETGKIYWVSDLVELEEDLPDDLDDGTAYIVIPHKNDLDLGKRLVSSFVEDELPSEFDNVERIFRRPGAYSRFKALLTSKGLLEGWYKYENAATLSALKKWGQEEGIDVVVE